MQTFAFLTKIYTHERLFIISDQVIRELGINLENKINYLYQILNFTVPNKKLTMKNIATFTCLFMFLVAVTNAQVSISTNTTTPDPSSILDLQSSDKGFLPPRMTMSQRNGIANTAKSLLIFQTDQDPGYYYNSGTPSAPLWVKLTGGEPAVYGMAFRSAPYDLAAKNVWYDIPLTGGNTNLSNIYHDTQTSPEKITVGLSGKYLITYILYFRQQGSSHHGVARLNLNSTSEIPGSYSITNVYIEANYIGRLMGQVIVSLAANDYFTVQAGTNFNVTNELDIYSGPDLPTPVTPITASVVIKRIGP